MVDFHTHILPKMDDGASSVEESEQMLLELDRQGVTKLMLTSHYYPYQQSIPDYLTSRQQAFERLKAPVQAAKCNVLLGAEVYLHPFLINEHLEKLCLQGTRTIPLEMPFSKHWTEADLRLVEQIADDYTITPLIAHVEKYPQVQSNPSIVLLLLRMGCLLQVNTNSLVSAKRARLVTALLKNGLVHALGSDCHNMEKRKPQFARGVDLIRQKCGEAVLAQITASSKKILAAEPITVDVPKRIKGLGLFH